MKFHVTRLERLSYLLDFMTNEDMDAWWARHAPELASEQNCGELHVVGHYIGIIKDFELKEFPDSAFENATITLNPGFRDGIAATVTWPDR